VPTSHCSATRVLPLQELAPPFTTPVRGLLAHRPTAHGLWKLEAQGLLGNGGIQGQPTKHAQIAQMLSWHPWRVPAIQGMEALLPSSLGGHPKATAKAQTRSEGSSSPQLYPFLLTLTIHPGGNSLSQRAPHVLRDRDRITRIRSHQVQVPPWKDRPLQLGTVSPLQHPSTTH
jgi:hypothetical protein